MLERIAPALLKGNFVCETTDREGFRWLKTDAGQTIANNFFTVIERNLTQTAGGQAFYLTWGRPGAIDRQEVRKTFAQIKQSTRPVIEFLTLIMDAGDPDCSPSPGDYIEYPALLKTITENAALTESLRKFSMLGKEFAVTDMTARAMLDRVIDQMVRWGYLILTEKEGEIYRFTGKLDYYYEIIGFLKENTPEITTPEEQETKKNQESLL